MVPFDVFPWIQQVLGSLAAQMGEQEMQANIRLRLRHLGTTQRGAGSADFGRTSVRLAYIAKLGPITFDTTRAAFSNLGLHGEVPAGFSLFSAQRLEVLSLGGGPATDALGFLDALNGPPTAGVELTLVDHERAWDATANSLIREFIDQRPEFGEGRLEVAHVHIDLANDIAGLEDLKFFSEYNDNPRVLLCSRVLTAVGTQHLADFIANSAKPGMLVCLVGVERARGEVSRVYDTLTTRFPDHIEYEAPDSLPWSASGSFQVPSPLRWLLDQNAAGDPMAIQIDQFGFIIYLR